MWLQGLDLHREGITAALIDTTSFGFAGIEEDLESTKELLIKYAGEHGSVSILQKVQAIRGHRSFWWQGITELHNCTRSAEALFIPRT